MIDGRLVFLIAALPLFIIVYMDVGKIDNPLFSITTKPDIAMYLSLAGAVLAPTVMMLAACFVSP